MVAHHLAGLGPHPEQDALPLVVAGPVLVRRPEVPDGDRAVDGADDLAESDRARGAGENVPPADAALGADETSSFEREQDLLEVRLAEAGALGDVAYRGGGGVIAMQRQREQGSAGVVAPRRDTHPDMVGRRAGATVCCSAVQARSSDRRAASEAPEQVPLFATPPPAPKDAGAPVLPDYGGACLSSLVPALLASLDGEEPASWLPEPVRGADQVVLLVLDGLGFEQLTANRDVAPALSAMHGRAITSVVPTTTATALTSITTGSPPAAHGIVGYRMHVAGSVLNVLRWTVASGDARQSIPPSSLQHRLPFAGREVPVVSRAEFARSGFSEAHLAGSRLVGWRLPSSIGVEVSALLGAGERFVYAYYDGVDKVAHEHGLGEHYRAELSFADRIVADLLARLPAGAALVVTADHGQVEVPEPAIELPPELLADVEGFSGEGRFRWLHAWPGRAQALAAACLDRFDDVAWVRTRRQLITESWFGGQLTPAVAALLGDVALVARQPVAFSDPADTGELRLLARHGSVTSAEMLVPLLAGRC